MTILQGLVTDRINNIKTKQKKNMKQNVEVDFLFGELRTKDLREIKTAKKITIIIKFQNSSPGFTGTVH